ncbi:MAG: response regulator [Candidatus Paceibacterota bacterium]
MQIATARTSEAFETMSNIKAPLPRGNETILVVDDDPHCIDVIRELLTMFGYQIISAASGEEAIHLYETYRNEQTGGKIDLIIIDVFMSGMSGIDAIRKITGKSPDVKFLMNSGLFLDGEEKYEPYVSLMSLGCRGFMRKPFTLTMLAILVRSALDG